VAVEGRRRRRGVRPDAHRLLAGEERVHGDRDGNEHSQRGECGDARATVVHLQVSRSVLSPSPYPRASAGPCTRVVTVWWS